MKKLLSLLFVGVLVTTLAACQIDNDNLPNEDTAVAKNYVAVDINPSIEFITDEEDVVLSLNALNEDAETVIADLELIGLPLEEALDLYLDSAENLGFIVEGEEAEITVTVESEDITLEEKLKTSIENHLRERNISGLVSMGGRVDEALTELSETYEISIGKARMIRSVLSIHDEYTIEDLVAYEPSELMSILREDHHAKMAEFKEERQESAHAMKEEMQQIREERQSRNDQSDNDEDADNTPSESYRDRMKAIKDEARNRMRGNAPWNKDEDTDNDTTTGGAFGFDEDALSPDENDEDAFVPEEDQEPTPDEDAIIPEEDQEPTPDEEDTDEENTQNT